MSCPVHVQLVITVASGLYEHARKCTAHANGMRLLRMAADVIDHTVPDAIVLQQYHYKAPETSDARFLAMNRALIAPLAPENWPPRKVRAREWGEFTRVMQGLDEALGQRPASAAEGVRNRTALEDFARRHLTVLEPADRVELLTWLAPATAQQRTAS